MVRVSLFNSPLLLGFEHLERTLDRLSKVDGEGYPPYNIEQTGPNGMRISLAVAGFTADDLALTVEENQLIVRGRQRDENDRVYLHRGIAARQFQRTFLLAEGIEIEGTSRWCAPSRRHRAALSRFARAAARQKPQLSTWTDQPPRQRTSNFRSTRSTSCRRSPLRRTRRYSPK